jgi:hypothetical protein
MLNEKNMTFSGLERYVRIMDTCVCSKKHLTKGERLEIALSIIATKTNPTRAEIEVILKKESAKRSAARRQANKEQ